MNQQWIEAQEWERKWHDNCANSYHEETKQFVYAHRMGLEEFKSRDAGGRIIFDFADRSVIDIGGGPYSLLLKSRAKVMGVLDPCRYPEWVLKRYEACGISFGQYPAEDLENHIPELEKMLQESGTRVDLALIYNCLQHTQDPEKIVRVVRKIVKEIRIFEWIDTGVSDGHLHDLKEQKLNEWLHGNGKVERINQSGCVGKCYYGIFPLNI